MSDPSSLEFITWLHRTYYAEAHDSMRLIKGADGREVRMTAGVMHTRTEEDNSTGRHIPPSSSSVADFMAHFAQRYRLEALGAGSRGVWKAVPTTSG